MHTILKQQLLSLGNPEDEYEHHIFLSPLQLHRSSKLHLKLSSLINKYVEETRGNRGPKQLEVFKYHWQWILLGLSRSIITNSWLLVSLDTKAYAHDEWLQRYDIKYSSIKPIVDYLEDQGLITVLKGKKYKDKPSRTRLFPTATLSNKLWEYALEQEQPIEGPYLRINETDDIWEETMFQVKADESHPDMDDMIAINEFIKPHRWACKAPIRLVYKHTPFQGGRLITPFQNLPDRRARIRINTLIDDQPICEVDFNANHLRLVLALKTNEYAGDTPYEDICHEAGVASRDRVKRFLTVAMGADNESSGRKALHQEGFDNIFINRIYQGVQKRYPKLELFSGWGIFAQNFEGQILKDVMLEGIKEDIVCLPVHDAV
ncbi:hypothetical protein OAK05_08320, partial [Gammaproteobacteria bacterium]|nr:hypothetical protein [Gammaproteobacteria bacterium]